ncbi:MAG: class I SAM-dependent methyltransferase [Thermoplasmata archaeon]|nr:class I SAM-dependent methyltransferase [Thermoplasmata archaeon]
MEQDREKREFAKITEYADLRGKAVLEVGCGNGRASAMLVRAVGTLTAIDPDSELINSAKTSVPGADFLVGSGEALDFPDGKFDAVIFTFSLHHQDSAMALKEAHRVLRPGGQLLIIEPSKEGDVHPFFRMFRNEDRNIENALEAIAASDFVLDRKETFPLEMRFDDNEDLYDYYFKHFKIEPDPHLVQKMDRLLGDRKSQRPLVMEEMVTIFLLHT